MISRDLALIKVSTHQETRGQVLQLAEVFRARVQDVAIDSITVEITGHEEKIDRFLEMLTPYGILEMVRTGIVAMRRGKRSSAPGSPLQVVIDEVAADADDTAGMSV
jgi:acetolactate synthase-1/3 small subunit